MRIVNNKKFILKFIIAWIPALCIMALIFSFSAKEAKSSASASSSITVKVVSVIEKITGNNIPDDSRTYGNIHWFVRKTAHFLEYMALGASLIMPYSCLLYNKYNIAVLCEATSVFYAATDEFHQLFVPGRDGNIKDVCIDGMGALVGIVFIFILLAMIKRIVNSKRGAVCTII